MRKPSDNQPLAGTTVIDLTRVLSGPYATMILGDLGADVIKVERIGDGDETRHFPPLQGDESHYFLSVNRNKRSIAVDLKHPRGRDVARTLAQSADVLVENFRPGVTERLGLDYSSLSAENPGLVYCSISGFGQTGPLRSQSAFDIIVQALSGAMSVNGELGGAAIKLGLPMGDLAAALFAPIGILAALSERAITGHGKYVDVGMLDSTVSLLAHFSGQYFATETSPEPAGSSHHNIVPYGVYEAIDGRLVIGTVTEVFWPRLCDAIDRPDLTSVPRYERNVDRLRNRDELDSIVQDCIKQKTVDDWCRILTERDIPHAPILTVGQALNQPQAMARGFVRDVHHSSLGPIKVPGPAIKFLDAEVGDIQPPPVLGQHTIEVLRELGGYSGEAITSLVDQGAVNQATLNERNKQEGRIQ